MPSDLLHAVGRRKTAVARTWIKRGTGKFSINGRDLSEYFETELSANFAKAPLVVTGLESEIDVKVVVRGGGMSGQAGAVRLGVARALLNYDESLKKKLREEGLLTVDARVKERKKYGRRGARRSFQFVKR
jgi:small subunit ribosomal protein S9